MVLLSPLPRTSRGGHHTRVSITKFGAVRPGQNAFAKEGGFDVVFALDIDTKLKQQLTATTRPRRAVECSGVCPLPSTREQ